MSELIRCIVCNGRKTFTGLGLIEQKCGACHGIGWTETAANDASPSIPEPIKLKRKTRTTNVNEEA